ncbi:MAG: hypothetical protein BWK80_15365 [Desulfobacteraceae bacterium IS3]|nr:MAG: hypothetical protein BWK80_15365 [Desulfobacteraceae bacterium IS3]
MFSMLGILFWKDPGLENKELLLQMIWEHKDYFLIAFILLSAGWGLWIRLIFRTYILPVLKIADEIPVIYTANPAHRIFVKGGKEIRYLAEAVNYAADRYQSLRKDIDGKIRTAAQELEQEKNILASIISCLSEGIIVCNPSGAILLFNRKAEEFLSYDKKSETDSQTDILTGQFMGIGRNISCVINSDQINRAIAEITEKLSLLPENPGTCFAILGPNEHFLKVEIVPILSHIRELVGFILRINNITQTDTQQESLSFFNLRLIPTQIQSVLETVRSNAEEKYDIAIRLNMPDDPEWIYADSPYLTSAMIFFSERVRKITGISTFDCHAGIEKDYIYIDLIWKGAPVSNTVMDEWNESVVIHEKGAGYLKLSNILWQHEAEWWSSSVHKSPEKSCLRIFFPSAEPYRFRSILPITLAASRPEFYDFDLLNRPDTGAFQHQLLSEIPYTVIDTETTGLDPLSDEIISIGAVRIVNGRVLKNEIFNILIDPQREISEESIKIHGIRQEMLRGQPTIGKVLPLLYQFSENTVLIGHNVAFDMRMFQVKEFVSSVRFTQPVLDTMFLSAVIHSSHRYHSLEAISERLGVTITGRHTALGDALAAAEIFLKCIPLLARNGILTLNDALQASMKTKYARISY